MSFLVRISAKHVAGAAVAVSLLSLAAVPGVSLVQASRTGAKMEADISLAQTQLAKHEASLRDAIALATGVEKLSVAEAKRAAGIALRRPDSEGGRLAVVRLRQRHGILRHEPGQSRAMTRAVSPEVAQAVTSAATQYVAKAAAHQAQLTQVKSAYALELDSGWSGMWLRMAGYPTISLSAPKTRITLPPIETSPKNPSPAPAAVNAAASSPAAQPASPQ